MEADQHTRQIIVRLLSNMAGAREIRQYLERFSNLDAAKFAVVKVGGAVLRDRLDTLASSLSFLHRVGLIPIVIHGAGPQLDTALAEAGIETAKVDGKRVTHAAALRVVRRVVLSENLRLVEALQGLGTGATPIAGGVFEVDYLDRERYGLVGRVTGLCLDPIRTALAANSIPVLCSLGETGGGQILNVNADTAAHELVRVVQPYKVVFLTGPGGLLDEKGRIIPIINLSTEYEHLLAQPWVHSGMRFKLREIHSLLQALPPASSVSVTRPAELAKELFTHRGSGTLIKRGEQVTVHTDWSGLDRPRLRELLESGFGGRLAESYFERIALHAAYVSSSYRAAAIITRDAGGHALLDKFAVVEGARAEGLGRTVWGRMRADHPMLLWRARQGNPVHTFYAEEADGCIKRGDWTFYWYGVDDLADLPALAASVLDREPTMSYAT